LEDHNGIDSKFRLVILVAKRAKQILKGSKKKIDITAENPLTVAIQEMKEGKIDYEMLMNEEEMVAQTAEELLGGEAELTEEALVAALSSEDTAEEEVVEAETDVDETDEKAAGTEDGDAETGEIVPQAE
jgi:DNA-directed RNA polymerase subunit omega